MTSFQIISIVIALLTLAGGMITAFVKLKTDIAKVQAQVEELQLQHSKLSNQKADQDMVMQLHKEVNSKLDNMSNQVNMIFQKLMK